MQRFEMAAPISISLTTEQVAWLDQQRQHGSIPRSAVIRQAIDSAMALEAAQASQPQRSRTKA